VAPLRMFQRSSRRARKERIQRSPTRAEPKAPSIRVIV